MFGSKKDDAEKTFYCSFCGKSQHEVSKLIAGPKVFICNECTELCWDIVKNEHKADLVKARAGEASPLAIARVLDDSIAGFLRAKYILSLAVVDRLSAKAKADSGVALAQRHLMIGPVGSGKRRLAQAVASAIGIAFAAGHARALNDQPVERVWEALAFELLRRSDYHKQEAGEGLVYLELDDGPPDSLAEFYNLQTVEFSDLMSQGLVVDSPLNLSNVTIVLGGTLPGLASERGPISGSLLERLGSSSLDGSGCRVLAEELNGVSRRELIDYGLPKKLVEQIPYVAALRDLYDGESEEDLGA